ncbi:MAG TPA: fructose-6-phosphate aldolase [Caldisericia bacterium]|nr:fructose-6-phosphate aldolase [Caldisericia bacterium]
MKIFLDTANVSEIKEATNLGVIDGVTTNPTLIAKEKGSTLTEIVKEIVSIIDGPVSVEVVSIKADDMVEEAKKLHSMAPSNIVIKVPICEEGLKAIKRLSKEGIKTNCTLIFSVNQGILAIKAGATYVSPFVGRIDDIGWEGMDVVRDLVIFIENYGFSTQVIASSIRHPLHVTQAAILGAHVATIPFSVLQKMVKHPLTDSGIEKFLKDWEEFSRSSKSGTLLS